MPLYTTSEDWTHHTTLLLRARPTTTRIVTKYTIPPLPRAKLVEKKRRALAARRPDGSTPDSGAVKAPADAAKEKPAKAYLELRAYDPESGACLKYRTEKAAEVGRLIAGLGRMGRAMAALPEVEEEDRDVVMEDAGVEVKEEDRKATTTTAAGQGQTQAQGNQGTVKGKKKKGKR